MRGKVANAVASERVAGITPAYAGKSVTIRKSWKHRIGSPPPMRGKASRSRRFCSLTGITPAYAGKSIEAAETVFER